MGLGVIICSKLKSLRDGGVAKASLNRANKLVVVDAKPSDLPMSRLKLC